MTDAPTVRVALPILFVVLLVGCGAAPPGDRLLRQVPADTPVAIWIEPPPEPYVARLAEQLPPALDAAMDALVALERPDARMESIEALLVAVGRHFKGRWDAASRAEDGLLARPHAALYTFKGRPYVRVELASGERFLGLLRRLAEPARLRLPAGDEVCWDALPEDEPFALLLSVHQDVFGLAFVSKDEVAEARAHLLGQAPPERSLADSDRLAELRRTYGLDGMLVDMDLPQLARYLVDGWPELDDACRADFRRIAGVLPHVVSGTVYGDDPDLDVSRTIVPLSTAARAEASAILGPPPGLVEADAAGHLLLGGVGLRLGALLDWMVRKGAELRVEPFACEALAPLNEALVQGDSILGEARATPLARITGFALGLKTVEFGPDGFPTRLDAFLLLGADDAQRLLAEASERMPFLKLLNVPHDAPPAELGLVPPDVKEVVGPVFLGSGAGGLGLATGRDGAERLARALGAQAGAAGVFLDVEADVAFFNDLEDRLSRLADGSHGAPMVAAFEAVERAISSMWGRGRSVYRLTERGIEVETRQRRRAPGEATAQAP